MAQSQGNTVSQISPFSSLLSQKPLISPTYQSPSTQTSTSAVGTQGQYAQPNGVIGAISNIGKGIATAINNPSSGGGLFGPYPTANAQTVGPVQPTSQSNTPIAIPNQGTYAASPQPSVPQPVGFGNGTTYGNPPQQTLQSGSTANTQNGPSTYNPYGTPINNGATNVPSPGTGTAGIWSTSLGNLANTQTNPVTAQSSNSLLGQANGLNPAQNNINTLSGIASNGSPQVDQAIRNVRGLQEEQSEIASNPNLAANVSAGRAQNISGLIQGAESAVTNALGQQSQQITAGTNAGSQQLTGQNQQITAANNAGGLANTAQGNQITAQGNAATLTQPRQQGYVLLDPTTGQPVGGTGGATNAAFQGGQIGAAETAGGNTFAMNQANTAAKGIQGTIQQYIAANPSLNASSSTIANAAQQWLQGKQLGDPAYQNLFNYINEYISTLAPILGVGGDTTNLKTQIAQSFINAQASGQSISQVLTGIGQLADQKLQNLVSAGQGGGQVAGGTPQGSTPTSFGTSW